MADTNLNIEKGYFMLLGYGKTIYEGKESFHISICAPDPSAYPKISTGYLTNKTSCDEDTYFELKKHKPFDIIKGTVYADSKKGLVLVSLDK